METLLAFFKTFRAFFRSAVEENQELKDVELPNQDLIEQAFSRTGEHPAKKQRTDKCWLENYLVSLKPAFIIISNPRIELGWRLHEKFEDPEFRSF